DEGLAGGMFVLCALGLLVQGRLGVFDRPGVWRSMTGLGMPAGTVAFLAATVALKNNRVKDRAWLGPACYALSLAVLAAMLVFGRRYRGGLYLPGLVNPTEVVKPLLVVFSAAFLQRRGKAFARTQMGLPMPPRRDLLLFGALWLVPMALVFGQSDLGLMMLLNMALVAMLCAASGRFRYLPLGVAAGVAACAAMAAFSCHAAVRVAVWRDPFSDAAGKGWQALQALMAMFAGGTFGAGLGGGAPQTVPIVTSDFAYAAIAEELGLLGCLLLCGLYAAWFARGWRIAGAAGGGFAALLGAGLVASLAAQALVNLAGVTKALPMTGVTLPFISQGSSSLVVVMATAGILAALSDRKC
ncbi:MAG: FtsW/RodA/SpoVE family cell cycle protein, partial [Kiritimatiellaeota bacterium]|nr:FtsW/RodA/SpoVE family cell cycle protein [Kiritimatiellota bacterium]